MNDIFKTEKEAWLKQARYTAMKLLRTQDTVTIDDVLAISPRPKYLHRNTNGAVFDHNFTAVDFTRATHPAAKGRWVRVWKLRGAN